MKRSFGRANFSAIAQNLQPLAGNDLQSLPTMIRRADPTSSGTSPAPVFVVAAHQYAAIIDQSISLLANTSVLVLQRSQVQRNLLILRNNDTVATIYFGWGSAASAFSTLALPPAPAGSVSIVLFDAVVPQDDLYAYATGNCTLSYAFSTFAYQSENIP